jgi:hypothetical protein
MKSIYYMEIFCIKINIVLNLFILGLLAGCASMSTMQTARVTDKNEFGFGVGGGVVKSEIALGTFDTIKINAPFLEGSLRYGVTDKIDVGARVTIIGTAVVDGKYQFLGNKTSKFAGSVGFGVGYLNIVSGGNNSEIFDLMAPVYLSYYPTEWLSIYTSPRYVYRINSYRTEEKFTGMDNSHWYGITGGVRIGGKTAFIGEYSYFGNNNINKPFSQITMGVSIGIK